MKKIVYGGAFNPPTKAHLEIIKYLLNKFPENELIILPTNNLYDKKDLAEFHFRFEMLEIICQGLSNKISISDYEASLNKYQGTYYILEHFNHPYFVIGADSLQNIHKWINFPSVVSDNKFIVIPRDDIDMERLFIEDSKLCAFRDNFIICYDFHQVHISSTSFRTLKDYDLLDYRVTEYIQKNHLYEEV